MEFYRKNIDIQNIIKTHLNVNWLRPEKALWDTIASILLKNYEIIPPSLDLGCGNGFFNFITAGGTFSLDFDWFKNVDLEGFWDNRDIYDVCLNDDFKEFIVDKPAYSFTYGLDHKKNLLAQARGLHFYDHLIYHDANDPLPFDSESLNTVFSNILYWLPDQGKILLEISRLLKKGGRAIFCLPNVNFYDFCPSYKWRETNSELLRLINRGRSDCLHWATTVDEFGFIAKNVNFEIVDHHFYLSPLILKIWDIGFRPLSCLLIGMANSLADDKRKSIKAEWIETAYSFIKSLYELEKQSKEEGGFHLFVLQKF